MTAASRWLKRSLTGGVASQRLSACRSILAGPFQILAPLQHTLQMRAIFQQAVGGELLVANSRHKKYEIRLHLQTAHHSGQILPSANQLIYFFFPCGGSHLVLMESRSGLGG